MTRSPLVQWNALATVVFAGLIVTGLMASLKPSISQGTVFTVNSTIDAGDAVPGDGLCTLRAAIEEANVRAGENTVLVPTGTFTLTAGPLYITSITSALTIQGAGPDLTIIDSNGLDVLDLFYANTSISDVTIRNGRAYGNPERAGAGIYNYHGILTVTNGLIADNTALRGGGIANYYGAVTIISSTIYNNTSELYFASGNAIVGGGGIFVRGGSVRVSHSRIISNTATSSLNGGGIYSYYSYVEIIDSALADNHADDGAGGGIYSPGGVMTITNSSISYNTARIGGGIFSDMHQLWIRNTTLFDNIAIEDGGGILNDEVLTITNSTLSSNIAGGNGGGILTWSYPASFLGLSLDNVTITRNMADADNDGNGQGGGIYGGGVISLANTLIGGNIDHSGQAPDCAGTLTSQGYNLLGNNTGCNWIGAGGDQVGTSDQPLDPRLGPLQDNGGSTLTRALLPGSPAIDAGNPAVPGSGGSACLPADQRDVIRPQDVACDIGAFEAVLIRHYLPVIAKH